MSDWDEALADLRHHWGSAYVIDCLRLGLWVTQRRDSHSTFSADGPEELREKIAADYRARPVPRQRDGPAV